MFTEQDNVTRKRRRIDPPHGMGGFPPYGPSGPYGGGGGGSYGSPGKYWSEPPDSCLIPRPTAPVQPMYRVYTGHSL